MKRIAIVLSGCALAPALLLAQGIGVGAGRWLSSPQVTEYRVGLDGFSRGPFSFRPTVQYLEQGGESKAYWAGDGGDLALPATATAHPRPAGGPGAGGDPALRPPATAQPYLRAGGALGMGRAELGGGIGPGIGAWGGAGAELVTLGPLGARVWALLPWRTRMRVESIPLGFRIGSRIGRERAEQAPLAPASSELPR